MCVLLLVLKYNIEYYRLLVNFNNIFSFLFVKPNKLKNIYIREKREEKRKKIKVTN